LLTNETGGIDVLCRPTNRHAAQQADPVAQLRCLLKISLRRGVVHCTVQVP
jgi:hypothetical protein